MDSKTTRTINSKKSLKINRILTSKQSKKKKFIFYSNNGKKISDKKTLERIKKLRIPPNYENVKISNNPNSKIQAIGTDNKGRKQYIYNRDFIELKKNIKYEQYIILGKYLKKIQQDIDLIINKIQFKSYNQWEQPSSNIAIVIYLLDKCLFRIGNFKYYELYGSHGCITLQKQHINLNSNKKIVEIKFIGKKGVINQCTLTDTRLFNIFKTLKNKKIGDFLFDYTSNNLIFNINTIDIQKYLNNYNTQIMPKMFRTWHTNCCFIYMIKNKIDFLMTIQKTNKITQKFKKNFLKESMLEISQKLHNTPTVLKNSYLDNILIDLFLNNTEKLLKLIYSNRQCSKEKLLILIGNKIRK